MLWNPKWKACLLYCTYMVLTSTMAIIVMEDSKTIIACCSQIILCCTPSVRRGICEVKTKLYFINIELVKVIRLRHTSTDDLLTAIARTNEYTVALSVEIRNCPMCRNKKSLERSQPLLVRGESGCKHRLILIKQIIIYFIIMLVIHVTTQESLAILYKITILNIKYSVPRRQSKHTHRNIKRLAYCQCG